MSHPDEVPATHLIFKHFFVWGEKIKERLENNRIFVVATNETTAPAAIAFPLFF